MADSPSLDAVPDPGPLSVDARLCVALQNLGDLREQLTAAQASLADSIAQLSTIAGLPSAHLPERR